MAEHRIGGASSRARAVARKLAMQALYQWQLNPLLWQDLCLQFRGDAEMARADRDYFEELIRGVLEHASAIDTELALALDRPTQNLDPTEHAILLIGGFELMHRPDVPFRVVITEAVGLAKRFGATGGQKYVNAVLDKTARHVRSEEIGGPAAAV
jgi:N utilization substance protein B